MTEATSPAILQYALVTAEHLGAFKDFNCGPEEWNRDLNDFLPENALTECEQRLNNTHVFYDQDSVPVAYVVLATELLEIRRYKWLRVQSRYGQIPAMLIGRLAVDAGHQRRQIGRTILALLRDWAERSVIPYRLMVLEVDQRNVGAIKFYEREGFEMTPSIRKGGLRYMMYDLGLRT